MRIFRGKSGLGEGQLARVGTDIHRIESHAKQLSDCDQEVQRDGYQIAQIFLAETVNTCVESRNQSIPTLGRKEGGVGQWRLNR